MDMLTINSNQSNQNLNEFIGVELVDVNGVTEVQIENPMANAKQFLDKLFPLAKGSHQNVCSYVVYYQHILMFFADGSHSGLRHPYQFVALNGHKSDPSAILLQDRATHVKLTFDRNGVRGADDFACIEDIQLEGHRHWISLLNMRQQTIIEGSFQDQLFTAKDGSDYLLKK